ncbi:MAG: hypothetical protein HN350_10475 [Phycisphaerales bacterium]|nr:hypothetical protein [Phycisphaerales bacterium]
MATASGLPLLHAAAEMGRMEQLRELLGGGVNPDIGDHKGFTALHHTTYVAGPEAAKCLLLHGATVDAKSKTGLTPLGLAAQEGSHRTALVLIEAGANVNAKDMYGYTPLSHAMWRGDGVLGRLLVEKGAAVDIFSAVGLGKVEEVKALLKADGTLVHSTDGKGRGLLHWAAANGEDDMIKILLDAGVKINTTLRDVPSPLGVAIQNGCTETAKYLVKEGAYWSLSWSLMVESLVRSARYDAYDMAAFLLSHGAKPNVADSSGSTPIGCAVYEGHVKMVALLLRAGAAPDLYMEPGFTLLDHAKLRGMKEIVTLLEKERRPAEGVDVSP